MRSWRVGVTRGLRWDIVADTTHNASWLWHDRFTERLVCSQVLHIVELRQRPVASPEARLQAVYPGCNPAFQYLVLAVLCWSCLFSG
jgi:hypothetical protein